MNACPVLTEAYAAMTGIVCNVCNRFMKTDQMFSEQSKEKKTQQSEILKTHLGRDPLANFFVYGFAKC